MSQKLLSQFQSKPKTIEQRMASGKALRKKIPMHQTG